MGTAHYLVCLFLNLAKTYTATGGPVSLMYYLAIFSVYVFLICFSSSWGPVAWVYQSEVFPLRVRGKGTGLATLSNWLNNAVIAFVVPMIQKSLKPNEQQMYLIFGKFIHLMIGTTGMMMATFVYFFVPETMSKSLEEMDDLFGAPEGGSKAERDLWNSEEGKKYRKNAPVVGGH